jgi:glutamyl-tRNA synthetase
MTEEEIANIREEQEINKTKLGIYGVYAVDRDLSLEEIKEKLANNEEYVIRLKSPGNSKNEVEIVDCVKGKIKFPENDMDIVLLKKDGTPTYHFAHAIDDHLMHTTHVIRGDEWVSSLPLHLDLFNSLGFKPPKYCHIAPLTKVDEETGNIRKLSKRKDPELNLSYFRENGIPKEAIKLYLSIISNTNFEEWYLANPDKDYTEFEFNFSKCPVGGTLFDLVKLDSVAKIYISKMKAEDIYNGLLDFTNEYDKEFYEIVKNNKDYLIDLLNIERNVERPRKDLGSYKDVKKEFWYMFDELFKKKDNPYKDADLSKYDLDDLKDYITNVYDSNLTQEEWFNNLKEWVSGKGYATNRKEYKENPDAFKGDVTLFCEGLRVMLTTNTSSPNLYDLLKIYGKDKLIERSKLL